MNCFEETELVISYIEDNINRDIDYNALSKMTGVPCGLYSRIFSYICGVSIAEYLRKRRLMFAAQKILKGDASIIQIALECGYESHSAFTRAFKEHFNIPPTGLTEGIYQNNYYNRFSFHKDDESYLVMKGRKVMAELVKIEYEEMSERFIIGVSKSDTGFGGRELWDYYFNNGIDKKLNELESYFCTDIDPYIGIGYARDFPDEHSLGDEYIVGKYFKPNTCVPNGLTSRIIPKSIIAKAQIKGKNFDDILNNAYVLINDMAQKNGYKLDYSDFYWSEVYTLERFCEPSEKGGEIILDRFMPCTKEVE
jgi:AraC family transcriptional regulator